MFHIFYLQSFSFPIWTLLLWNGEQKTANFQVCLTAAGTICFTFINLHSCYSSYESKAPPFTINQSGNEHYSPPRLTSFKPQHTPVRKSDIVNPAVSESRLLSPLDESVMSNSFHGFTSPASRASLNSSTCCNHVASFNSLCS